MRSLNLPYVKITNYRYHKKLSAFPPCKIFRFNDFGLGLPYNCIFSTDALMVVYIYLIFFSV